MIVAARRCSNAATLIIGAELADKTLDECEQACSASGVCERFAYGAEPFTKSRKCQLMKIGCVLESHNTFNLYWPRVRIVENPSDLKDACTHVALYSKNLATIK